MVLQGGQVVKPKNQRAKRALEKREAKLIENDKQCMFIRGGNTSELITQALKELYSLKKPNAVLFKKKNIMRPFEDQTSIEFFSDKNDASLFMFGSHSKKRPHNLVIGRLFDGHILDMIELGVEQFRSMTEFQVAKCSLGTKPCLLFAGEPFEQDHEYKRLQNLLIDYFRGPVVKNIRLQGLEHVMVFSAVEGKVYLRSYKISMKKSGSRTPRIELEEMGPSMNLVLRRTKLASDDLYKLSCKVPKNAKPRKKKNLSRDAFGSKHGRIHMQKQDFGKLQTRKMKGLKVKRRSAAATTTESEQPSPKKTRETADD